MRNQVEIDTQIPSQLQGKEKAINQQQNPQVDSRAGRNCITSQENIPYQENRQKHFPANQSKQNQSSYYPQREVEISGFHNARQDVRNRDVQKA